MTDAAQEEVRARVEEELRQIPEPFQAVVVLRDIEGFSYEEVAEILGVNLGTVKSRLMRGRAHLKERLAGFRGSGGETPKLRFSFDRSAFDECQGGQVSKCTDLRKQFSAYLDGAVAGAAMQEIAAHLEACSGCAAEFAQWRTAQSLISSIGPAKAPQDLGLRLRVALSQESANTAKEKLARGRVRWENTFRPLIWQVTAGFASTVALLGGVALLTGMFAFPSPALARDEPLGMASSPRFLYTSMEPAGGVADGNNPLVVLACVNGEGRVYDYKIVSGNTDSKTRSQLEDSLAFSVFAPAQVFGQPVRGTVLLSFSGVSVPG